MRLWRSVFAVMLSMTVACFSPGSPTPTTGLTGTIVRGPITPVCQVDVPCAAPFSAGFTANHSGIQVSHFRSDATGAFTVWLTPGTYQIVPDVDAPLTAPTTQVKTVTVGNVGLTRTDLEFDTGIR
jgi:hypothetical protein